MPEEMGPRAAEGLEQRDVAGNVAGKPAQGDQQVHKWGKFVLDISLKVTWEKQFLGGDDPSATIPPILLNTPYKKLLLFWDPLAVQDYSSSFHKDDKHL